jgi:transcriptional regulator with XRE-family HTH domain
MATFTPTVTRDRSLHNGYTVVGRPETFPERLKRLRTAKGWTTYELAERARIGRSSVAHYELDRGSPMAAHLHQMARALGTTMDYLWSGEAGS